MQNEPTGNCYSENQGVMRDLSGSLWGKLRQAECKNFTIWKDFVALWS